MRLKNLIKNILPEKIARIDAVKTNRDYMIYYIRINKKRHIITQCKKTGRIIEDRSFKEDYSKGIDIFRQTETLMYDAEVMRTKSLFSINLYL